MENDLIHIAISPNALAPLIKNGSIHAVDFKCLDANSKQAVWALFLSTLKATQKELIWTLETSRNV
jgi:hypothetical protein